MEVIYPKLAQQMVQDGKFLVHQTVMGHTYGIAAAAVRKLQASGKLPVLDLDRVADVTRLKESGFQVRCVFLAHVWLMRVITAVCTTCGSIATVVYLYTRPRQRLEDLHPNLIKRHTGIMRPHIGTAFLPV
jgi:hypothetical protein